MDVQWIPDAYEAANGGDWEPFAARVAPGYRHRVPSMGIDWEGREAAVAGLRQTYEGMGLTQSAVDVAEHGDFVIASVVVRSNQRPEQVEAVHVFRQEGGQLVECWGHYPPIQ